MIKVITYGTDDLLHYGHIRLLERAKALGDYLIVGITADSFDRARGKINVQQSLIERIEAVKATGIADEIIVEEYEGQKIDDIKRYNIDIFTVGSDWKGHFDYLNEFCKVIYLDRTQGISSSELRAEKRELRMGLIGESIILNKFERESKFVNGVKIEGVCMQDDTDFSENMRNLPLITNDINELLDAVDAVFVISHPTKHYHHIRKALEKGKHVLCESPIVMTIEEWNELKELAEQKGCVLMESIKTAYSMAYSRLLLLLKGGVIGKVVSVDATCTSMSELMMKKGRNLTDTWNSICSWGPTALLPILQILGTEYNQMHIYSHLKESEDNFDLFTKISFSYPHAVASIKVGMGVKSEGELIISGTEGYIFVPAPWWKTDYFEVRYENPANNKRYFYQLEGEGIRYEMVSFLKTIETHKDFSCIETPVTKEIVKIIEDYNKRKNFTLI